MAADERLTVGRAVTPPTERDGERGPAPGWRRDPRAWTVFRLVILAAGLVGGLYADLQQATFTGRPAAFVVADLVGGWSFLVAGTIAWQRRPTNRIGPLLILVGISWFVGSYGLIGGETLGYLARSFQGWYEPLLAWIVLAYPSGRLRSRPAQFIVGAWLAEHAAWSLARLILERPLSWYPCVTCRETVDAFVSNARTLDAIAPLSLAASVGLAVAVLGLLVVRSRTLGPATRRRLLPALFAGIALGANVAVSGAIRLGINPELFGDGRVIAATYVVDMLVAVAVLAGLLQEQLARGAVARLVVELEGRDGAERPRRAREALRRALGEPTLDLLFDDGHGGYLDVEGAPAASPIGRPGRAVTSLVDADRSPIGMLVHDPGLLDDPGLVSAVTAALRLEADNRRLADEVQRQLGEVRASRARIVAAGDAERRRVERDLHDGAQQRLIALSMDITRLRITAERTGDGALRDELSGLGRQLDGTIAELRELARGIVPGILGDAGLPAAIESLALRSPVPVTVDIQLAERLPAAVESTAYFVVAEALTNVARHAAGSTGTVTIRRLAGGIQVVVQDTGPGGADPARGTGLQGLADRVGAIDGRLTVESRPGSGTRLIADLPVQP